MSLPGPEPEPQDYEKQICLATVDFCPLPPVANSGRRSKCRGDGQNERDRLDTPEAKLFSVMPLAKAKPAPDPTPEDNESNQERKNDQH